MKHAFRMMTAAMLFSAVSATAQITESMGTVTGTTTIASHEAANGFDNDNLTYSGTADVRITNASVTGALGYAAASGGGNIFFNSGKNFVMSGINTNGCTANSVTLTFGIRKEQNALDGSTFGIEYSTDGGFSWTSMSFPSLPTGSNTSHWYERQTSTNLPSACDLRIRFTNNATGSLQYRLDDVRLSCGEAAITSCEASISADGPLTFCNGDDVVLTANDGDSWFWSTGETTQSITVTGSGTYFVTTTNGCCSAMSAGTRVLVYPNPTVLATATPGTITLCPGDSSTLTARTLSTDLIISEYVEGSSFEKYIELYNNTGAPITLTSNYELRCYHNGACDNVAPTFTIPLVGTINDQMTFVISNNAATLYTANQVSSSLQFNGDDVVALYNSVNGEYVDIFGSICNDPGSQWTAPGPYRTENHTLRRLPCVYSGITVNPNLPGPGGFSTLGTEWSVDSLDVVSGLGSHTITANSYSWSPSTTPASGAVVRVKPSVNTTYTVSAAYCNGCPGVGQASVTIAECPGGRLANPNQVPSVKAGVEAYPNPFGGNVTIVVSNTEQTLVKVEIYNVLGVKVADINNSTLAAGTHNFVWNGSTNNGAALADGIYTCRVIAGNDVQNVTIVKSNK